jgi:DNA-binding transcriptional ArsR family regulator
MPMPEIGPGFPEVDRVIHEPARLAILTVLSACSSADFMFLQTATGLSKGNLSVQLTRLEESGLIYIDKVLEKKKTRTTVKLSSPGRIQLNDYWQTMKRIQEQGATQSSVNSRSTLLKLN